MNGKGDKSRPMLVSDKKWAKNWESIFLKKNKKKKGTKHGK